MTPPEGITLRPLDTFDELLECVRLQEEIWGAGFRERVPPAILRIARDMGGVASGAFDADGTLLGFVFGITGVQDGRTLHWSDMLAVRPDARGRGIGRALKLHQRELMLERGVDLVRWTFDPLEARNAWLNLACLGAVARRYEFDYYGSTGSPLHVLGTDRLVVDWEISSERVARHLSGARETYAGDPGPVLNPVRETPEGPACEAPSAPTAPRVRIAVPSDIQQLKATEPVLAREWREHVRVAFDRCFVDEYVARDFVRGAETGYYVVERADS